MLHVKRSKTATRNNTNKYIYNISLHANTVPITKNKYE